MGIDLTNYHSAIAQIFAYSFVFGALFTVPVFLINWRIRYALFRTKDIIARRITFFSGLVACTTASVFYLVPMVIDDYVNKIVKNKIIIAPQIQDKLILYVLVVAVSYILVYFLGSIVMSKLFKKYKHQTVFYSNNKVFGLI